MKRVMAFALIVLASGVVLSTQNSRTTNDQAEIRKVLDRFAAAFRQRDIDGVMTMYSPDVMAFDFNPPLQYAGKDAYRNNWEAFFSQFKGPMELEFRDLKVVASGKVGYAYFLERFSGTMKNGQKVEIWGRCTSGFQKINGKWLDTHDHCSEPVDFTTGKAALDLKP